MIDIVEGKPESIVAAFSCSRRLATRISTLYTRKIGVTHLILEEAMSSDLLLSFLMEKELLKTEAPLEVLNNLLAGDEYSELSDDIAPVVVAQAGFFVIAAEEETLLLDSGTEDSSRQKAQSQTGLERVSEKSYIPSHNSPVADSDPSFSVSAAFSASELARIKVNIFAGASSVEKVSALRQFAYSDAPTQIKLDVFMKALADEDSQLRTAAINALRQSGLPAEFTDTLRLFSQETETDVAGVRLVEILPGLDNLAARSALLMLAGCFRDPEFSSHKSVLKTISGVVPFIGGDDPALLTDFIALLQEKLFALKGKYLEIFREAFSVFDKLYSGAVVKKLSMEILSTNSVSYRSLLLDILSGLPIPENLTPQLQAITLETVCSLNVEDRSYRILLNFITENPDYGLQAMAGKIKECDVSHQRSFIRYFDNLLHSAKLKALTVESISSSCLELLRSSPLQLRADIIETHVLCRDDISEDIRREASILLLHNLHDYAHWPLSDYLENSFVSLGAPAIKPLLQAVIEQKNNPESALLTKALGRIGVQYSGEYDNELGEKILRELSQLTYSDNKIMDSLHISIGMLASRGGVAVPVNEMVIRTLLSRLCGSSKDAPIITALGYAAAGSVSDMNLLKTIFGICRNHLETEQSEPSLTVDIVDGEEVFNMGDEVGIYSELIPAAVSALDYIVCARVTPDDMREEMINFLLSLWARFKELQVSWGLVNVTRLTDSLGHIGSCEFITDRKRVEIASMLRRRASQVSVLDALSKIVAVPNRLPQFDRLAAAIVLKIMELLNSGAELSVEDHEFYLRILVQAAMRGRLEVKSGSVERLWLRIVDVIFAGLRHGIAGSMKNINKLLNNSSIPAEILNVIRQNLKVFTVIART